MRLPQMMQAIQSILAMECCHSIGTPTRFPACKSKFSSVASEARQAFRLLPAEPFA
jgi:hypothetical protein